MCRWQKRLQKNAIADALEYIAYRLYKIDAKLEGVTGKTSHKRGEH
jgi:hypothetical protein